MTGEEKTGDEIYHATAGYNRYRNRVMSKIYQEEELYDIILHRDRIAEKCSKNSIMCLKKNYGIMKNDSLLVPMNYDGVLVDADDVFAAVYMQDHKLTEENKKNKNLVLCILFTNDPYIPVLPMVYAEMISFKERLTKHLKNEFLDDIRQSYRNLKYPISTCEEFEDMLRRGEGVHGKPDKQFILEQLYDARNQIGLFDTTTLSCEIGVRTAEVLAKYKFIFEED